MDMATLELTEIATGGGHGVITLAQCVLQLVLYRFNLITFV